MIGFLFWLATFLPILAMAIPCCGCRQTPASSRFAGRGFCFCCGPGYYDFQPPAGGPLEWELDIGSVTGSCFGSPCTPAAGTWFARYSAGCTWITPRFSLCGVPNCFAWVFSIGFFPSCDANPVDQDAMRCVLANVCGGAELIRYENECDARLGTPPSVCDPPVNLTCNGPNTLRQVTTIGVCFAPANITATPAY